MREVIHIRDNPYYFLTQGGYGKIFINDQQTEIVKVIVKYDENRALDIFSLNDLILSSSVYKDLPNTTTINHIYDGGDHYKIVMPYKGVSLSEIMKIGHIRDVNNACKIVYRIARVCYNLLRNGIQHTDIKPGNILVDKHGVVTLIDYSCMSINYIDALDNDTLKWCETNGTYSYLAPEIIFTKQPEDTSMIWSLGILLCTLISHHPIDKRKDNTLKKWRHVYSDLKKEDAHRLSVTRKCKQKLPKHIWEIVKRCFVYDAAKRLTLIEFMEAFSWMNLERTISAPKICVKCDPSMWNPVLRLQCIEFIYTSCCALHAQIIMSRCFSTIDQLTHLLVLEINNDNFKVYCLAIMFLQASIHYVNLNNDSVYRSILKECIQDEKMFESIVMSICAATSWRIYSKSLEISLISAKIPYTYDRIAKFFKKLTGAYTTCSLKSKFLDYLQ